MAMFIPNISKSPTPYSLVGSWVHEPDYAARIGIRGIFGLALNNNNTKDTQQGNIQV
jgi:hypothetical protein